MATMRTCKCCKKAFVRENKELLCPKCELRYQMNPKCFENTLGDISTVSKEVSSKYMKQIVPTFKRPCFRPKGMKARLPDGSINLTPEYTQAKIDYWANVARCDRLGIDYDFA